jgi:quinol monooxygenase YgiN
MAYVEVTARAKVRQSQLEGFKAQAAEIVRLTRERDAHTLRCDWFINEDGNGTATGGQHDRVRRQ